jgi:hypothetical protein
MSWKKYNDHTCHAGILLCLSRRNLAFGWATIRQVIKNHSLQCRVSKQRIPRLTGLTFKAKASLVANTKPGPHGRVSPFYRSRLGSLERTITDKICPAPTSAKSLWTGLSVCASYLADHEFVAPVGAQTISLYFSLPFCVSIASKQPSC